MNEARRSQRSTFALMVVAGCLTVWLHDFTINLSLTERRLSKEVILIAEFDADGDLPPGIYLATVVEVEQRYGRFNISDRRVKLAIGGEAVMAIENRQQLEHTQSQVMKLELALDTLKREESAAGRRLLSPGFVEQLAQMRREIDEYLEIAGAIAKPRARRASTGRRSAGA